ncbi:MAG: hypothetical protein LBR74_05320 [Eubacterium sp.]|nr:hypothetical protein [Eubacterium sp.]
MGLSPSEKQEIQVACEVFCKKIIKHEIQDCIKELQNKYANELYLEDLSDEISVEDDYFSDSIFDVIGYKFIVKNNYLAQGLRSLKWNEAAIILLSFFESISDVEIGRMLNMIRQTVKYRRDAALKKLKKEMEKNGYE